MTYLQHLLSTCLAVFQRDFHFISLDPGPWRFIFLHFFFCLELSDLGALIPASARSDLILLASGATGTDEGMKGCGGGMGYTWDFGPSLHFQVLSILIMSVSLISTLREKFCTPLLGIVDGSALRRSSPRIALVAPGSKSFGPYWQAVFGASFFRPYDQIMITSEV
jgi:hypothetical protein